MYAYIDLAHLYEDKNQTDWTSYFYQNKTKYERIHPADSLP